MEPVGGIKPPAAVHQVNGMPIRAWVWPALGYAGHKKMGEKQVLERVASTYKKWRSTTVHERKGVNPLDFF